MTDQIHQQAIEAAAKAMDAKSGMWLARVTEAITTYEAALWRPIVEAPQRKVHEDPEEFLGYCPTRPEGMRIVIIFWMPSENMWEVCGGSGLRDKPTMFRPLPTPPQEPST
jgi:hypothetical protein